MGTGDTFTLEDLELALPENIDLGSKTKIYRSHKFKSKSKRTIKTSKYSITQDNGSTLDQLEELCRNPAFACVSIQNINDYINSGAITSSSRKYQYGASIIDISMKKGWGKWKYFIETVDTELHNRWKYYIMEDFDTDGNWATNGLINDVSSSGYGLQEQTIEWIEEAGSWRTSTSPKLVNTQSLELVTNGAHSSYIGGFNHWVNYDVSVWCYCDDTINDDSGIYFRYIDSSNYYRFSHTTEDTFILYRKVEGAGTTISSITSSSITLATEEWHHKRVIVIGNQIKCFINGELVIDVIESSLCSGRVGVYGYYNNTNFDDFRCINLPVQSLLLPSDTEWSKEKASTTTNTMFGNQKLLIEPQDAQFSIGASYENCLVYYDFNAGAGNVVYDKSKYQNNATIIGATWYEDSDEGTCLYFDGTDDYAVADLTDVNDITSWTINLKFRAEETDGKYHIEFGRTGSDRLLLYHSSGTFRVYDDVNNENTVVFKKDIDADTWYDLTIIIDGYQWFVFYDNELVKIYKQASETNLENIEYVCFGGAGGDCDPPTLFGECYIKRFRAYEGARWDVALGTDQTVSGVWCFDDNRFSSDYDAPKDNSLVACWHFDEGVGSTVYDSSGNGHDSTGGTFPDWLTESFRGEAGTALDFESTSSDHITFGDHNDFSFGDGSADNPFSVSAWIKLESSGTYRYIVEKPSEWILLIDDSGYYPKLTLLDDSASGYTSQQADSELNTGEWYHFVATYDGSGSNAGIKLYINGILIDSTGATDGDYTAMENKATDLYIGGSSREFDGVIDEVRIHNRELSAEEIAARYRSEPYLHDWYQSTRVYDKSHQFNGMPIIHNGLVMIDFPYYDVYEERGANVVIPAIYCWYENSWHNVGFLAPRNNVNTYELGIAAAEWSEWYISELTDQKCSIVVRWGYDDQSDLPEGAYIEYKFTIVNGSPIIYYESDSSSWMKTEDIGIDHYFSRLHGNGEYKRWAFMPEAVIANGDVEAADVDYTTSEIDDNWIILMDDYSSSDAPKFQKIIGHFSDSKYDDIGTDDQFDLGYQSDNWKQCINRQTQNGGFFYMPYDISLLYREADSDLSDVTTDGDNDQTTLAGYTGDGHISLDGTATEYAMWNVGTLEKGTYTAIARVAYDVAGGNQLDFNIDNDNDRDGDLATELVSLSVIDTWYEIALTFHTDGTNDIYISIEAHAGGATPDSILVDHFFCIPISNGVDFPKDIVDRGLVNMYIKRGLKGFAE